MDLINGLRFEIDDVPIQGNMGDLIWILGYA
jgi:hypothetical protein